MFKSEKSNVEDSLISRQSVLSPVDGAVVLAVHVLEHRVLQGGRTTVCLCLLWMVIGESPFSLVEKRTNSKNRGHQVWT